MVSSAHFPDQVSILLVVVLECYLLLSLQYVSASRDTTSPTLTGFPKRRFEMRADGLPAHPGGGLDKLASRVLHWHMIYCGENRLCKDYKASCFRCSPCQCDLNCTIFGDCCPDLMLEATDDDLHRPFTGSDIDYLSCESSAFPENVPRNPNNNDEIKTKRQTVTHKASGHEIETKSPSYFMMSRCPQAFTGDSDKCENSGILSPVATATNDSIQIFKNIHCARCHDVFDVIPWNLHISCEKTINLTNIRTQREVIFVAFSRPDCTVVYVPPPLLTARRCYSEPGMISQCNITGQWNKPDSFLERACHSYLTPKRVDELLYKNVYCYMCNHDDDPKKYVALDHCQTRPISLTPAIEVTLPYIDLTKTEEDGDLFGKFSYKRCGKRGIYDYSEESCREMTCEKGHQLVTGTCRPLFLFVQGLRYELYFGLRPTEPIITDDHNILYRLASEMEVYFSQTLLHGKFKLQDFAMSFNTTDENGHCSQMSSNLGLYARVVSQSSIQQSQLQDDLLRLRNSKIDNFIINHTWNMSFQGFHSETVWHMLQPERRRTPESLDSCMTIVSNDHLEQRKTWLNDGTMKVGTTTPDPLTVIENKDPSYIRLTDLLYCPRVQLLPHEYSFSEAGLRLEWDTVLAGNRFFADLEGNVSICLSDFVQKLEKFRDQRSSTEETLAIVLLTLSLLFLVVCLVVFLLFSVLRSLPGKNNMVLVICLFASQLSLLIGYLVDDASRMCAIMGATLHYFTLCLFCALIVCSYQVYAMFTTMHLSRDAARDIKSEISYLCFTFIIPLVIVSAVIAAHLSQRVSWRSFGYGGGSFCLLSSSLSLWISMLLPVAASMLAVCIMFCLTSNSLQHSKDVETSATDERHVNFYFKATLLVTLTWVIGMTGIVTSVAPLKITFIIFQALLGLYVFVSLVLTPRVTRLLSGSCCQSRRAPPRGRTSLNMKMASSDDCPVQPPCIMGTGYRRRDPNISANDSKRHPIERYTKFNEHMETIT